MAGPKQVFARGKLPFSITSSSVNTGYAESFSASFGGGYEVTNFHQDNYGTFENEPLQGPFTEEHVGGNQHRHAPLNDGSDNILTRAEVFHINTDTAGELRIYGPEVFDTAAPRATMLRGNTAKAPVNIRNIQTTTGSQVHGNFRFNYEVVQTQGRKLNNRYFIEQEGQGFQTVSSSYIQRYFSELQFNNFGVTASNQAIGYNYGYTVAMNESGNFMAVGSTRVPIFVYDGLIYLLRYDESSGWYEERFLTASTSASTEPHLGVVDMTPDGTVIVAGAAGANYNNNATAYSGSVVVFRSGSSDWYEEQVLTRSAAVNGEKLGYSVAVNSDATVIIAGAPHETPASDLGVAVIYRSGSGGWVEEFEITGAGVQTADEEAGSSVAINDAGDLIAVGTHQDDDGFVDEGSVQIYRYGGSTWSLESTFYGLAFSDRLGSSVSFNSTGDILAAGAIFGGSTDDGAVNIYRSSSVGGWSFEVEVTSSTANAVVGSAYFGSSVKMNNAGNKMIVGAGLYDAGTGDIGLAVVFVSGTTGWQEITEFSSSLDQVPGDSDYLGFHPQGVTINGSGNRYAAGGGFIDSPSTSAGAVEIIHEDIVYLKVPDNKALPERDSGKTVITEIFNAPGGTDVSSRGVLDAESEEYAANNALPWRNYGVRDSLNELYTAHTEQFGFSSINPGEANYHKVHRNTLQRIDPEDTSSCESVYDNWWVQHPIPRTDIQYAWITASSETTACDLGGYQRDGAYTNQGGAYTDIDFISSSETLDHYGLQDPNKEQLDTDIDTNTFTRPSGNISFSTYVNGPYGYSSWKQIEGARHPVARALRRNNTVSILDTAKEIFLTGDDRELSVKAKRANSSTNFIEPPVSSKYRPMHHNVLLKGRTDPFAGHRIKHTYANNLVMYANKSLNRKVGALKQEQQIYDRLSSFYLESDNSFDQFFNPGSVDADNPISRFLSLTYKEVVYPKEQNTYLGKTRGREKYIVDLAGFTKDGYDRLFGTQRAFWRDNIDDRHRTPGENQALNSQGYSYISSSLYISGSTNGDLSLYPLDKRSNLKYDYWIPDLSAPPKLASLTTIITGDYGGELNYQEWYILQIGSGSTTVSDGFMGHWTIQPRVSYLRGTRFRAGALDLTNIEPKQKPRAEYTAFLAGYRYDTGGNPGGTFGAEIGITSSFDSGLQWRTAELAGKNPWFDSYEDYVVDIRAMAKDHTIVPEFNISEQMDYFIIDAGGNFRKQNNSFLSLDGTGDNDASAISETSSFNSEFFATYAHSDLVKYSDKITDEHKGIADLNRVTLKCKGIKKLLPYNGFYPSQRTIQLASLLSQSIGSNIQGGWLEGEGPYTVADINTSAYLPFVTSEELTSSKMLALLQPFYAPGILYNSIKSGISVDWPTYTGSTPSQGFSLTPDVVVGDSSVNNERFKGYFTKVPDSRISFESLIFPTNGIPKQEETNINSNQDGIENAIFWQYPTWAGTNFLLYPFMIWNHQRDSRYELATSNFLAEVPRFFLKDQELVSFASQPSSKWKTFESSKRYYMDVVLRKTEDFVMMESYRGEYHETGALGQRATGRYFGFPMDISASNYFDQNSGFEEVDIFSPTDNMYRGGQHCDPAYAAYTPPYHEGEAIARLSFQPETTREYTLDEVFAEIQVENIFIGLEKYTGSVAEQSAMSVDSSVNYFGKVFKKAVEYNLTNQEQGIFQAQTARDDFTKGNQAWVISPRWECPVLNFANQEGDVADEVVITSSISHSGFDNLPDFSGSGFGRGMWSGYGEIPTGQEGIYLEVRDSFPQLTSDFTNTVTGSLLEQIGMRPTSEKIGQLADKKVISEAIVAIPFLDSAKIAGLTTEINGRHLISIPRNYFNRQKNNILSGQPAIKAGEFGSETDITSTSVSDMILAMQKYVIPPQYNFLEFDDIRPFAMYFLEFEHTLDQQDLADIWQGVMPKIAITAEKDEVEFSHPSGKFEFFSGNELPQNLRWMIFKVKRKAEKNYFAVTADSTDDNRFQFDFQVGRKAPEYSYNWPYDYFSLVELAKVEVEVEYKNSRVISTRTNNIAGFDGTS